MQSRKRQASSLASGFTRVTLVARASVRTVGSSSDLPMSCMNKRKKKHMGSEKCPARSRARQDARPGTHVGNIFQQLLVDPVQPVALRRVAALVVDVRYHLVHERERSLKGCVVGVLWRWARDPKEPTDGNR